MFSNANDIFPAKIKKGTRDVNPFLSHSFFKDRLLHHKPRL